MTPTRSSAPHGPRPQPRRRLARALSHLAHRREATILSVLILLCILFAALRPANFLTAANLQGLGRDTAILLILSAGTTFLVISGILDLSIGGVLVCSQAAGIKVMASLGGQSLLVITTGLLVTVLIGAAWGLVNGTLIAGLGLNPFIVTLATLGAASGTAQLITDGNDITDIPVNLANAVGLDNLLGVPILAWIATFITLATGLLLATTRYGRLTYAIGSNKEAARRAGIRVTRHTISMFMLTGTLSGIAGFLSAAQFATTNIGGHEQDALLAITAVALGGASLYGGIGTMFGTLIGVCIPAVLQNGLVILGTQPYWYQVVVAIALVASIALDKRSRFRLPQRQQFKHLARSRAPREQDPAGQTATDVNNLPDDALAQ